MVDMATDNEVERKEYTFNPGKVMQRYTALRTQAAQRDMFNKHIAIIRSNQMGQLYPEAFPDSDIYSKGLVIANTIELASKAVSENLADMPRIFCVAKDMAKDKQQDLATKRTQIVNYYFNASHVAQEMYSVADKYASYGSAVAKIEIDWDNQRPTIRFLDPRLTYFDKNAFGEIVAFYQRVEMSTHELCLRYPQHEASIKRINNGSAKSSVIFFHDKDYDAMLVEGSLGNSDLLVDKAKNLLGRMMVNVATVPSIDDIPTGLYNGMIIPLLAKNSLAVDTLQVSKLNANAPIAIDDTTESLEFGMNAIVRSDNPDKIRRIPAIETTSAQQQMAQSERELNMMGRIPGSYTGSSSPSIVTGAGVDAQNQPFTDTQVNSYRVQFAGLFQWAASAMLELDEKIFGDVNKSISGKAGAAPFQMTYTPSKIIQGDYTVQVEYLRGAGMSMAQYNVITQQLVQQGIMSADTYRRNAPFNLDSEEEEKKIMHEQLYQATEQSVKALIQSFPALAAQGQDISENVRKVAQLQKLILKGKDYVEAFAEVFAPEPTPEEQAAAQAPEQPGNPLDAINGAAGGGAGSTLPTGLGANGLMQGVAQGQAGQAPGGMGALASIASRLSADGKVASSVGFREQRSV